MTAQMRISIVGESFHKGAYEARIRLKKGEELWLIREANNSFDKNAVAVHNADGQKLGYIPRQDAPAVAKVLDSGKTCKAVVRLAGATAIEVSW